MKERTICMMFLVCLVVGIITGCNPTEEKKGENSVADAESDMAGIPFTRNVKHDTCLLIAHKVQDYDLWKASFDLAQSVREKHGIKALNVYREKKDTNLALVYTHVQNLKNAKGYITSENLQKSMLEAGVQGAMDLYWMTKELAYTKPVTDTLLMFMSFKVISYDRWEKAFLDDYRNEPDRDFQVINVLRGIDDDGLVSMLFAVNDPNYVQKMEKDNGFRAKMLASGVISYPVTYKLNEMPI